LSLSTPFHLRRHSRFPDDSEVFTASIRESGINAFCHRDYGVPEEIRVAILKDLVEIRNPGGLFSDLTIAEFRASNILKRHNSLLST
jgi:ATP-dependent DNA helicase RecG